MGGMMFVGAGCGWLGGQLPGRVPIATVVAVCGGLLVAGIALTPVSGALAVTAVVAALAGGLPDVIYAPLSTELQSNTSSEFRATTMSIAESGFSIQMLWLFPAAGHPRRPGGVGAGAGDGRRAAGPGRRPGAGRRQAAREAGRARAAGRRRVGFVR